MDIARDCVIYSKGGRLGDNVTSRLIQLDRRV